MTEFLDNIFYFFTDEDYISLIDEYNDILYEDVQTDNNNIIGVLWMVFYQVNFKWKYFY